MTELVLGPLLRYVDETNAAIWVEVDGRCTVRVRCGEVSAEAHTFTVHGHHYAFVELTGLAPGTSTPYSVELDDQRVWPQPRSPYPDSRIRTFTSGRPVRVLFGSCRTSVPHDAETNRTHGVDVLRSFALRMAGSPEDHWPTLALFLGDQVYADETSQAMRDFIAARRSLDEPPGEELQGYEEYAHLYRLAWTDPANRWLLSTIPSAMIFDDHDIRDDWNTSATWREQMAQVPWWRSRIVGGIGSYWVYQHLGNLRPNVRSTDPVWADVRRVGRDGDAGEVIDKFAGAADDRPESSRWSFARDLGGTRLVVIDSRCGRLLTPGRREMLSEGEFRWLDDLMSGDHDHLLIGTSLPFLLPAGLHHLEAWNEAVCDGAWGRRLARRGERIRQAVDLEHWAAFQRSFQRLARMALAVARGERGKPPATVMFLSGDVHHSYLAEVERAEDVTGSRILQAVCSPIRNPLPRYVRFGTAAASYGLAWPMGKLAARSAKVPDPPFRWRISEGPWFDNVLASLDIDGPAMTLTWETASVGADGAARMRRLHTVRPT